MVQGNSDVTLAPGEAPLDCYEGISTPPRRGCARWPAALRLFNPVTGELVAGRCGATNLCEYCQALYIAETVEMLLLDAAEDAPELWMVLTAREHLTRPDCYSHLRKLLLAARRRWPDVAWFVQVEFQRRGALHLNLLIKHVPAGDRRELHELLSGLWCDRVDAEPIGQWSGVVNDAGGIAKYLGKTLAHGLKAEQAPPIGWRGHRTSQTGNYFACGSARVARQRAKESRQRQRELWKARQAGADAHDAELVAHEALELAARSVWVLTNDRGARVGRVGHDPARMILESRLKPGSPRALAALWNRDIRGTVEALRELRSSPTSPPEPVIENPPFAGKSRAVFRPSPAQSSSPMSFLPSFRTGGNAPGGGRQRTSPTARCSKVEGPSPGDPPGAGSRALGGASPSTITGKLPQP